MTTPRLGAPELSPAGGAPETTVNEQIRYIESGAGHFIFKDRDLATPPGSPVDGDCYLVAASATGAWAGHDGEIAFRINTAWAFITAIEGFTAWVNDENVFVGYDGAAWNTLSSPSGSYLPLTGGTLSGDLVVPDEAYDATNWNGSLEVPTKNAIRDKIETIVSTTFASAAEIQAGTESAKAIAPDHLHDSHVPQTLTDGATISWDMAAGFNAKVTLGGNRTLGTPTNPKVGLTYVLEVIQDGTGSRTMTWPASFNWGSAGTPTLSTAASKVDLVTLYCRDAATPKFRAVFSKDS